MNAESKTLPDSFGTTAPSKSRLARERFLGGTPAAVLGAARINQGYFVGYCMEEAGKDEKLMESLAAVGAIWLALRLDKRGRRHRKKHRAAIRKAQGE